MSDSRPSAESVTDFGAPPTGTATRWLTEIATYEREHKPWLERSEKIARLYAMQDEEKDGDRRFALLWSNVQVLKPTLYARDPKPAVTRRFRDKDAAARTAASLLERCLTTLLDRSAGAYGRAARLAVQDRLLSGRGVARVRYVPTIRGGVVEDESVEVEFIHRCDFGHTAGARNWSEVEAVWFVAYLDRDALVQRFGEEIGRRVPVTCHRPDATEDEKSKGVFSKAQVYEVWDNTTRRVTWVVKGMDTPLDEKPYPLKLVGKFPCPAPLYGTVRDGTLIPQPDYKFYEDQASEINTLTARISKLTEALRLVGFADGAAAGSLATALDSPEEVAIVPIDAWAMGKAGTLVWLPIREVAETLRNLIEAREALKRDAYEVTGLSDILRGQTQASETATAQQIKAQWGGIRVREAQQEVANFCAGLLTLMAEVVCGHFEPQRIASLAYMEGMTEAMQPAVEPQPSMMPGMPPTPPPTVGALALDLLKGPAALLHSRVDVESDSTIAPDEAAEREAVQGAVTAAAGVLEQGLPAIQAMQATNPALAAAFAPLLGEMMMAGLRTMRKSESIEAAADQFTEALANAAKQPPPPPPGPPAPPPPSPAEEAKVQNEQQRTQLDAQRLQFEAAQAQDESRHRDADREVQMAQIEIEAARPEGAVVQ